MAEDKQSKLKLYSLGIVVKPKDKDSDIIEVFPVEEFPMTDGLIADIKLKHNVTLPDANNNVSTTTIEGNKHIKAKWVPLGDSNRMSAPNVNKNETVILLTYADTNEYYWTTIFREPKLRRLEEVLYAFCNLPKGLEAHNKETSYWFEVSTIDKHIKVHTAKNDGEYCEYDIILDTEKGTLEIKDDVGNSVYLNSQQGDMLVETTNKITLKAPVVNIEASSEVNITTPIVNISANVEVGGNLHTGGNINADGSIIDQGGNTNNHSH